jgi:hypothetical protein
MRVLLLLLLSGLAYAGGCTGPCGCDQAAGNTILNISVYDEFGSIPPEAEDRFIWIEYEKDSAVIRETIWDGWQGQRANGSTYLYNIPSCVEDQVSNEYYLYLVQPNSSCKQEYATLMEGRKALLTDDLEWNGSVYSDGCMTGYKFSLLRNYFESEVPVHLYPDRYSKYSRSTEACFPLFVLLGLGAAVFRSNLV